MGSCGVGPMRPCHRPSLLSELECHQLRIRLSLVCMCLMPHPIKHLMLSQWNIAAVRLFTGVVSSCPKLTTHLGSLRLDTSHLTCTNKSMWSQTQRKAGAQQT